LPAGTSISSSRRRTACHCCQCRQRILHDFERTYPRLLARFGASTRVATYCRFANPASTRPRNTPWAGHRLTIA
jgi:hypothetical protein